MIQIRSLASINIYFSNCKQEQLKSIILKLYLKIKYVKYITFRCSQQLVHIYNAQNKQTNKQKKGQAFSYKFLIYYISSSCLIYVYIHVFVVVLLFYINTSLIHSQYKLFVYFIYFKCLF